MASELQPGLFQLEGDQSPQTPVPISDKTIAAIAAAGYRRNEATGYDPSVPGREDYGRESVVLVEPATAQPAFEPLPVRPADPAQEGGSRESFAEDDGGALTLNNAVPPVGTPEHAALPDRIAELRSSLRKGTQG